MTDARRAYAADWDQEAARGPKLDMVERIAWLHYFDLATGHSQEIGPEFLTEMGVAHSAIAGQIGIEPVLSDDQWIHLCKLTLEQAKQTSGKTADDDTPCSRMEDLVINNLQIEIFGGSESVIYKDGNRQRKVDMGEKTNWNLAEAARKCKFPDEAWRGRIHTPPGGGARHWIRDLVSTFNRDVRNGLAVQVSPPPPKADGAARSGGDIGGRNRCGTIHYKKGCVVILRDTGNDANKTGRDDEYYFGVHGHVSRIEKNPKVTEDMDKHVAEAKQCFEDFVMTAIYGAEALVYVSEVDEELYGPHPPAQDFLHRQRVEYLHKVSKAYPGRIYVVKGEGIVRHLDATETNIRDPFGWHRTMEFLPFVRNMTFIYEVLALMAVESTFPAPAREYIRNIVTPEMTEKMQANAAKLVGTVAKAQRVTMPHDRDLLGGSTGKAFDTEAHTTESGLSIGAKMTRSAEQSLFRLDSLGSGKLEPGGTTRRGGAIGGIAVPHSLAQTKRRRKEHPVFAASKQILVALAPYLMLRVKGDNLVSTADCDRNSDMHWVVKIKRCLITVQSFSKLEIVAMKAEGKTEEEVASIVAWSGRTFELMPPREGASVAKIHVATTRSPEVARTLPFLADTMCGYGARHQHFVGVVDPNRKVDPNGPVGIALFEEPLELTEMRRRYGPKIADEIQDCQGLAETFNDVWDYAGQAAGGVCYPDNEVSWREEGINVTFYDGCLGQECPMEGSTRLHEVGDSGEPEGMRQPTPSLKARQARALRSSALCGMHRETLQYMTTADDLNTLMFGARLLTDCGIGEAKASKKRFTPGYLCQQSYATTRVSCGTVPEPRGGNHEALHGPLQHGHWFDEVAYRPNDAGRTGLGRSDRQHVGKAGYCGCRSIENTHLSAAHGRDRRNHTRRRRVPQNNPRVPRKDESG